ncbi:MAG: PIG-L family deacetylase [Chloroflexota bacterium]|nr:PIG-L family deacetylase [Chloroflexota bacterium]
MPPPLVIFLSPHFDDIPLSCGGTAARLSRMGARCVGLVVCAAPEPEGTGLSDYANWQHEQWQSAGGGTGTNINEVRREEERAAMRLLGLEPVWLDVPDAPYRRNATGDTLYNSNQDLFGSVNKEERRTLVPRIADEIRRMSREHGGERGRVRVFAPLGVGHHVDHQLVFWAARRLGPRFGVLFYEDFPYTARPGALDNRLRELNMPLRPRLTPISELIGLKIAAITKYRSQLDMLFGSSQAMPGAVRDYARWVASSGERAGEYAERVWYMPPIYNIGLKKL